MIHSLASCLYSIAVPEVSYEMLSMTGSEQAHWIFPSLPLQTRAIMEEVACLGRDESLLQRQRADSLRLQRNETRQDGCLRVPGYASKDDQSYTSLEFPQVEFSELFNAEGRLS